jgi:hypothetical protein
MFGAIFWAEQKSKNGRNSRARRLIDLESLHSETAAKSLPANGPNFQDFSEQRLEIIAELIGFTVRPLCRSGHSPIRAAS